MSTVLRKYYVYTLMYMIFGKIILFLSSGLYTVAVQQDSSLLFFFFFLLNFGICKLRREAELPTWGKLTQWERAFD